VIFHQTGLPHNSDLKAGEAIDHLPRSKHDLSASNPDRDTITRVLLNQRSHAVIHFAICCYFVELIQMTGGDTSLETDAKS
jgi:hypothetical protein